jgi:hypothetical protein
VKRRAHDEAGSAGALARRYRRLFACYPAVYRAASGDEMLGVALAGTRPGQRWPALGEVRSLVAGGTRMRLGGLRSGARGPAWRDGCAAFTFLAAALLAAISLEALVVRLLPMSYWATAQTIGGGVGASVPLLPGGNDQLAVGGVVPAVIWPLVAVTAAMGWRRAAAAGASFGAVAAALVLGARYTGDPSSVVAEWWQFVLAVTGALAAVTWLAGSGDGGRRLPRRAVAAVAIAVAVTAAAPAVQSAFTTVTVTGPGIEVFSPLSGIAGYLRYGLVALLGGTLLVVAARLGPVVRRRVLLLSVPALAVVGLVHWTFGGFLAASPRFTQPVLLTAPQWAALAVVPIVSLATGLIWLTRHERMLRELAARPSDTA